MAPCLSKFPSPCLEAIFKHLPLVDLFYSVGLVCTTWYMSRRTELMRRRYLRLITRKGYTFLKRQGVCECSYGTKLIERVRRDDGSPWHSLESLEHIKFNCLCVPDGMHTIPFSSSLMNMSNITRLNLNLPCTTSNVTQVILLLDHLSERLVDLTLKMARAYAGNDTATREHALNVANVVDCLNRPRSVRHLNLGLSILSSHPPLLSCLSRLTTFAINVAALHPTSMDGWIYASVKQYAQNITSIDIYHQVDLHSMLKFDAQLASKFKILSVIYGAVDVEDFDDDDFDVDEEDMMNDYMQALSLFCARFSSLTKLQLESFAPPLPMTVLARCLSSLTQLVHLDLTFFGDIPLVEGVQPREEEDENGDGQIGQEEEEIREVEAQPAIITQVPSVRLLIIHVDHIKSHRDTERLFIPDIFPNLQVLGFDYKYSECPDCEIRRMYRFSLTRQNIDPELAGRMAECTRLARRPFRRCANLHTFALVDVLFGDALIDLDEPLFY